MTSSPDGGSTASWRNVQRSGMKSGDVAVEFVRVEQHCDGEPVPSRLTSKAPSG